MRVKETDCFEYDDSERAELPGHWQVQVEWEEEEVQNALRRIRDVTT